jgi:hypothetical protein
LSAIAVGTCNGLFQLCLAYRLNGFAKFELVHKWLWTLLGANLPTQNACDEHRRHKPMELTSVPSHGSSFPDC